MAAEIAARAARIAKRGEAGFLAALLIGALILTAETFRFRTVPWDPLGMAFWPRIQLGMLVAVIVLRLWQLRSGEARALAHFSRGIGVLAACIAFVAAIRFFGVYLATPVFFLLFAALRPGENRRRAVIEALVAAATILFGVWLLFDMAMGLRVMSLPFWMR